MPTAATLTVANGDGDAVERESNSNFSSTGSTYRVRSDTAASQRRGSAARFVTSASEFDNGDTIDACTLSVWPNSGSQNDMRGDFSFEDADNPADFATNADVANRTRNGTSVLWSDDSITTGSYQTSPELKTALQAVIDRAGWSAGNALGIFGDGRNEAQQICAMTTYDGDSTRAWKLDVDYTAGGGTSHAGAAALAGVGTLAPAATRGVLATGAMSATAALLATTALVALGTATLVGVSTLLASAETPTTQGFVSASDAATGGVAIDDAAVGGASAVHATIGQLEVSDA